MALRLPVLVVLLDADEGGLTDQRFALLDVLAEQL